MCTSEIVIIPEYLTQAGKHGAVSTSACHVLVKLEYTVSFLKEQHRLNASADAAVDWLLQFELSKQVPVT